jgi:hypothetical protein
MGGKHMPITEQARIEQLEKEVAKLKIHVEILADHLMTANTLPILGPDRWTDYSTALRREQAALDR